MPLSQRIFMNTPQIIYRNPHYALPYPQTHPQPIKAYYAALKQFDRLSVTHETAVRSAFQSLLEQCGRQFNLTLVPEHSITVNRNKRIVVDGALIDDFQLPHGYWEAKDIHDNLPIQVQRKFAAGYPRDNILFQTPQRAILWQNGQQTLDGDLTDPMQLIGFSKPSFPTVRKNTPNGGGYCTVQRQSPRTRKQFGSPDPKGTGYQRPLYYSV